MVRLVECRACDRHVRVDETACRFCGAALSVPAPRRWAIALGALPLLFACASEDAPDPTGPAAPAGDRSSADPPHERPAPPEPEPAPTTAVRPAVPDDDPSAWGQQSMPPDLGATIVPGIGTPEVDRPMATKYGLPPRPAAKYGAPVRPAKKYGAPPRPGPGDDPLGEL